MKHFLAISDLSSGEVQDLLDLAIKLKEEYFKKGNPPYFKGKVLGMIFQKPSLRTRVSFDMAMRHCGGDALYLSPNEIGLGKREVDCRYCACAFGLCPGPDGACLRARTCAGTGEVV